MTNSISTRRHSSHMAKGALSESALRMKCPTPTQGIRRNGSSHSAETEFSRAWALRHLFRFGTTWSDFDQAVTPQTTSSSVTSKARKAVCTLCGLQGILIRCIGQCRRQFHPGCVGLQVLPNEQWNCEQCAKSTRAMAKLKSDSHSVLTSVTLALPARATSTQRKKQSVTIAKKAAVPVGNSTKRGSVPTRKKQLSTKTARASSAGKQRPKSASNKQQRPKSASKQQRSRSVSKQRAKSASKRPKATTTTAQKKRSSGSRSRSQSRNTAVRKSTGKAKTKPKSKPKPKPKPKVKPTSKRATKPKPKQKANNTNTKVKPKAKAKRNTKRNGKGNTSSNSRAGKAKPPTVRLKSGTKRKPPGKSPLSSSRARAPKRKATASKGKPSKRTRKKKQEN